ncbi:MAG: MEDS domain-containing protein [Halobacteriales archaeon]|nr:MEDS domain-containing protein [Halobacteriales archaeon]
MLGPSQLPLQVPPVARARALGALVPRGEHAVAFAADQADALLAGFVLEGLQSDERVLVLSGQASPRAVLAKLRAAGAAPTRAHPAALRVLRTDEIGLPWPVFLEREAEQAQREGAESLRAVHLCGHSELPRAASLDLALPRRFRGPPRTLLCMYTPRNLRIDHHDAIELAQSHARILCV